MKAVRIAAGLMAILFAAAGAPPAKAAPGKSAPAKSSPASKPAKRAPVKQAVKPAPVKSGAKKSGTAKTAASRPAPKAATSASAEPATVSASESQDVKPSDEVTALRDLPYATVQGKPMTLDLYHPKRAPNDYPKPLLIFVHGGGWNGGDSRHGGGFEDFPAILTALAAQQNYVVTSINYRLSSEARFPAALQDVKSAIRWLRAHAGAYGIDVTRVAIWGEEAGGHLAALAGTSCGVAALEPPKINNDKEPSDCVQAVIVWDGITDLAALATDSGRDAEKEAATPGGAYLGCEPAACAPGFVKTTTPMTYIGAHSPPFLIQHDAKKDVPLQQSQRLFDALTEAHIPVEQAINSDTDTVVAEISIDRLEAFLNRTFPRRPMTEGPPARPKSGPLPY